MNLEQLSERELDQLDRAIKNERTRRAAKVVTGLAKDAKSFVTGLFKPSQPVTDDDNPSVNRILAGIDFDGGIC